MNVELKKRISELLLQGAKIKTRAEVEAGYPERSLPAGAEVTRFCPSPTGFVHIGSVYTALLCQYLAHQSDGKYILRIEDTDKKREVADATNLIVKQLDNFELTPDEGLQPGGASKGDYGPYVQSERQEIYLAFALELLQSDQAYPCFATADELETATKDQVSKKLRPGYYGEWALWRDKSDAEIQAALDADKPFVLRFKSQGSHDKRVSFNDLLKGKVELPENDLDVPLIKSDEHRLPTYHFAHVVDDHLMKPTMILRGDEWLPSTPLHLELCEALDIKPFRYAHLAPISVIDSTSGGKRKLSKRKDDEANVQFWLDAGYPIPAIKAYMLGLANSNFEDWYRQHPTEPLSNFKVSLDKLAASRSPLLDMTKVADYSKDFIANLPQAEFEAEINKAATGEFKKALEVDPDYSHAVLAIERDGPKPRKDLVRFADAAEHYGYFFDNLFENKFKNLVAEELKDVDPDMIDSICKSFLADYEPNDGAEVWLAKIRKDADKQTLSLRDYARILRVKLTGKNRTPDLWQIMKTMGEQRVRSRLKTISNS